MGRRGPQPDTIEKLKAKGSWRAKVREKGTPEFEREKLRTLPPNERRVKDWLQKAASELHAVGCSKVTDLLAWSLLVDAIQMYLKARSRLSDKNGDIDPDKLTVMGNDGFEKPAPEIAIMDKAYKRIKDGCAKFGLTPVDRSSLDLKELENEKEEEEFFEN